MLSHLYLSNLFNLVKQLELTGTAGTVGQR